MRIVFFEPGERGRIFDIENTLTAMQTLVGGHIETVTLAEGAVIICNEEGRMLGLSHNRLNICGPFFICGVDGDEFTGLPEKTAVQLAKLV